MNAQEFVAKWKKSDLRERASSQEHFIDLCNLLEQETPAKADPKGDHFTFEYGVNKQSGKKGWADVWKKDFFAWEYKGKHKDLDVAYNQLLQYRESLENPPLLIVSDIESILIHTNFTNSVKKITTFSLDDLLESKNVRKLKLAFTNPSLFRERKTPDQVTEEAATEFANLSDQLRKWGESPEKIAHFLIRLLFCLFAEDSGLLPKMVFSNLVAETKRDYKAFSEQLAVLFGAMATGGWFGTNSIPNFNGGLFEDSKVLELDSEGIETLLKVSKLDWSSIEPAILGTLFERSLDPTKRAQIGAHYTDKNEINLVIEPVLIAPLFSKWQKIKSEAATIQQAIQNSKDTKIISRLSLEALSILNSFRDEISSITVLDPACGSGNFLYVALKRLLDLEKEVNTLAGEISGQVYYPKVSPDQLFGIELNHYAYELAQATIWIGYIQWLNENGYGNPDEPILKPLKNFNRMDAILVMLEDGKSYSPSWPTTDIIVGNPPFLGSRKLRPILGDEYVEALTSVYKNRIKGIPDLVCFWFEKSVEMIEKKETKRAGLLATQAIRGGANRQVLEKISTKSKIFSAWSDREWFLDGAVVHVSIVAFGSTENETLTLNGIPVEKINPDLSATTNVSEARKLEENKGVAFQGTVHRGSFVLSESQALKMLGDNSNPNGRSNSDVIKKRLNGRDLVGVFSNNYIIDFGINMAIEDASQYQMPFEYVKRYVFPERQTAKQKEAREKWWLLWNPRKAMREALNGLSRYIGTPRVGKHRIFQWISPNIIPDNTIVVFARKDYYFFGVLQSSIHEYWARKMGTQLRDAKSGFRYTLTTIFETFPFPFPLGGEDFGNAKILAISEAAKNLDEKRVQWKRSQTEQLRTPKKTMTDLYNEYPTWLKILHEKLDEAVFSAYGFPSSSSLDEILKFLLDMNLSREAA